MLPTGNVLQSNLESTNPSVLCLTGLLFYQFSQLVQYDPIFQPLHQVGRTQVQCYSENVAGLRFRDNINIDCELPSKTYQELNSSSQPNHVRVEGEIFLGSKRYARERGATVHHPSEGNLVPVYF